jgi:hypothetical protein
MTFPSTSTNTLLSIYLTLGQYPILSIRLRQRMRRELYERGVIQEQAFEAEVIERSQRSQRAEGLMDPLGEESTDLWNLRVTRVRERLTDLLFSQHFNFDLFETLLKEELGARGINEDTHALSINPELAPLELVFEQAMTIERMPEEERIRYDARLQESKVVLIRSLISDQLRYINIARDVFTISDLAEIRQRKIGSGRIGGKAAGMLLAYRVLQETADPGLVENLQVAESYFIGSDEFYNFMAINNLVRWNDQKYKSEEEMRAEYPQILAEYECGEFTPDVIERLQTLLANAGSKPLIVRSSSLLEDNFGTSFAGKYDSIFLPNQSGMSENLEALKRAIAHIYGSTLNPAALLYRRSKGLLDYDERMAILIQVVQGQPYGRFFLPHGAGVAFSRNLYRWAPQIRREDGFVRLVWGLGTRAVDRVGNDYPRLIALSHPLLRPSNDPRSVRRYSQQFVDLIDLEENQFKTLPVHEVLHGDYPPLRYLAQIENDGFFTSLRSSLIPDNPQDLVLTFEDLLSRTSFAGMIHQVLGLLEQGYRSPVDLEFCFCLKEVEGGVVPQITILQCRPQAQLVSTEQPLIPPDLQKGDIVFRTHFMVPQGRIDDIRYVLYVPAKGYFSLPSETLRSALASAIGQINAALESENFICVGPGRWGSSNSDLGVPINYGDVYHAKALVELTGEGYGLPPEPSLGTHFFQDLLESQIYPLAVELDDPRTVLLARFFDETKDCSADFVDIDPRLKGSLRLIRVGDFRKGYHLNLEMDEEHGQGVAFLVKDR